jgi:hypothetical protein
VDITTELPADSLQERCCRFFSHFWQKIRRKISCGFQNPQETITYKGFSWEPKSAGKSAANVFPADFWSKTAGKSACNK